VSAPAGGVVRTVLGDIAPEHLGPTDYHEHLLMQSPLLPGDELDDITRSSAETQALAAAGITALVELTPIGLGRNPGGLATISAATGVHIVVATGVHREAHYPPGHEVRAMDGQMLAERFTADVEEGCAAAGERAHDRVRAGIIKCGVGYWSISPMEHTVLAAAAATQRRTGVAVVCHLEMGTAAHEVVELFTANGVAPDRLALAHADRNPDPGLHAELTSGGVYLGYDGMARTKYWPDSTLLDCLLRTAERGRADRLLLGGDVARRSSFRSYGGLPGMDYLPKVFAPRVVAQGGQALLDQILVDNPATLLSFPPTATDAGG
jgi:phosphotriesterase-related protein